MWRGGGIERGCLGVSAPGTISVGRLLFMVTPSVWSLCLAGTFRRCVCPRLVTADVLPRCRWSRWATSATRAWTQQWSCSTGVRLKAAVGARAGRLPAHLLFGCGAGSVPCQPAPSPATTTNHTHAQVSALGAQGPCRADLHLQPHVQRQLHQAGSPGAPAAAGQAGG